MRDRIRIPARGNGVTSLGGHPQGFLRVLYEGGEALPEREDFDWNELFEWTHRV